MKRLILGGLSVLLICAATTPAKASEQEKAPNKGACQSIPLPSPSGQAYLARLQAIQRCHTEIRSTEPQMSSTLLLQNPNLTDKSATTPAGKAGPGVVNISTRQSTYTSTVQLTPSQLVSLAYSGEFRKQGIPGYAALIAEIHQGEITAKDLVQSAVKAHKLPTQVSTSQGYLGAVQNQLQDRFSNSRR